MTRVQTAISLIVIIIMIGSSIIQFHHHDANGTMCMYFTSTQTSADAGHEHLYPSFCSGGHSMEDSPGHDESRCSLKLSSVKDTKQISIKDFSSGVIILISLLINCCLEHKTADNPITGYLNFKLPDAHVLHFQLRAPPALV